MQMEFKVWQALYIVGVWLCGLRGLQYSKAKITRVSGRQMIARIVDGSNKGRTFKVEFDHFGFTHPVTINNSEEKFILRKTDQYTMVFITAKDLHRYIKGRWRALFSPQYYQYWEMQPPENPEKSKYDNPKNIPWELCRWIEQEETLSTKK